MTTQPEALSLAEVFETYAVDHQPDGWPAIRQETLNSAAEELRRLHAENEALRVALDQPGVEPAPGWKLVPVEPTLEMAMAFAKSFSIYDQKATFPEAVKAMLEAAPQPAQQNDVEKEALLRALHAIDTVVVALPTFQVNTDGGIDAVAANIVTAIKSAADLLENGGAAPQPAPQPDARTSAIQSCIDRLIQGGKPAEAGMLRHHFAKDLGEE